MPKEITRHGKVFVEQAKESKPDKDTGYAFKDAKGEEHKVFATKNGRCYIVRTSKKSGKQYKQYLPKETSMEICRLIGIKYK